MSTPHDREEATIQEIVRLAEEQQRIIRELAGCMIDLVDIQARKRRPAPLASWTPAEQARIASWTQRQLIS
jgi:hypothetical protein